MRRLCFPDQLTKKGKGIGNEFFIIYLKIKEKELALPKISRVHSISFVPVLSKLSHWCIFLWQKCQRQNKWESVTIRFQGPKETVTTSQMSKAKLVGETGKDAIAQLKCKWFLSNNKSNNLLKLKSSDITSKGLVKCLRNTSASAFHQIALADGNDRLQNSGKTSFSLGSFTQLWLIPRTSDIAENKRLQYFIYR